MRERRGEGGREGGGGFAMNKKSVKERREDLSSAKLKLNVELLLIIFGPFLLFTPSI